METRNNNYLQTSNQESKINQGRDKINLLKTFQSKKQQKICSRFVSSIVILSILSVANSSFAFPARVKKETEFRLYNREREYPGQEIIQKIGVDNSQIEIEYCKIRDYCYAKGFSILRENRFIPLPGWVVISDLCNDSSVSIPFLPTCSWSGRGINANFIGVTSTVQDQPVRIINYYCDQLNTNNTLMQEVGFIIPSVSQIRNLYPQCPQ
ncbi:hypothetical protein [uncultured Nostoc sp.]|uniref:hypothetical protein n=1 Tax=uncultured Nostoc sp. TaxID=340711 RepID=UPI0035C9CC37